MAEKQKHSEVLLISFSENRGDKGGGANVGRAPARGERAGVWLTQSNAEAIGFNALSVWAYDSGSESR